MSVANKSMKYVITILILALLSFTGKSQEIKKWNLEDLQKAIAEADKPTIFNFWATFCKPCIEEIPYFQELVKKYDSMGVQLVLVSLDFRENYPKKIRDFAVKRKFTAPIVFLDESDADLFCPAVDTSWSGSIPASLFVNHKTGYRKFHEDMLNRKELEAEIANLIKAN